MNVADAAFCLEKLGNQTRLEIVRLLVRAGPEGLSVGEVQRHLDVPASTLSHHLSHLVAADLVRQERDGRILRCLPVYERLRAVAELLLAECCAGVLEGRECAAAGAVPEDRGIH